MLRFVPAAVLVTAAGAATAAIAAPRAESALECGIAADMAVVAHSLAHEQIQRTKANTIMERIYDVSQSDRGKELMKEILDAAYISKGNSSQEFAEDLYSTCMKSGGDMDPVLGKKL
jgi:lipopolysaccharide export LptBFGC system permease protein LptF